MAQPVRRTLCLTWSGVAGVASWTTDKDCYVAEAEMGQAQMCISTINQAFTAFTGDFTYDERQTGVWFYRNAISESRVVLGKIMRANDTIYVSHNATGGYVNFFIEELEQQ